MIGRANTMCVCVYFFFQRISVVSRISILYCTYNVYFYTRNAESWKNNVLGMKDLKVKKEKKNTQNDNSLKIETNDIDSQIRV